MKCQSISFETSGAQVPKIWFAGQIPIIEPPVLPVRLRVTHRQHSGHTGWCCLPHGALEQPPHVVQPLWGCSACKGCSAALGHKHPQYPLWIQNADLQSLMFLSLIFSLHTNITYIFCFHVGCMDTEEADIYLLIDGSTSINIPDFKDIKEFVKEVIEMFNIGPNNVRFGVVQYSHKIEREFTLDQYQKKGDLVRAIDNVRQIYGDTYTGKALEYMQPLFTEAKEQRRVPCHLIVLTDGEAHDRVKEPADRLRANQVNVYAIGIKGANKTQLEEISASKARTYFVNDFDSLKVIKDELVQKICSKEGKGNVDFEHRPQVAFC